MRTLEKLPDSTSARTTTAAGTIPQPRMHACRSCCPISKRIDVTAPRRARRAQDDSSALHDTRAVRRARRQRRTTNASASRRAMQERMARYGTSSEYIARRQVSVLTSRFVKHDPDNEYEPIRRYGNLRNRHGRNARRAHEPLRGGRMRRFRARLSSDPNAQPPDDIIHVSCSGYVSPSPVQSFLSRRGWLGVGVTHSYHMGCYGAFPAIRTAVGARGIVVRFAAETQAPRRSGPHRVPLAALRSARRRAR